MATGVYHVFITWKKYYYTIWYYVSELNHEVPIVTDNSYNETRELMELMEFISEAHPNQLSPQIWL